VLLVVQVSDAKWEGTDAEYKKTKEETYDEFHLWRKVEITMAHTDADGKFLPEVILDKSAIEGVRE
jgi:hypothetical protein